MTQSRDLWEKQAAEWRRLTPPGRPGAEDLAFYESVARRWAWRHGPPRVLVLGATPEMAHLSWPTGTSLLAADRCPVMLRDVWPGYPRPGEGALRADWLRLPLAPSSRDLIYGDGPFGVLPYPDVHRRLAVAVRALLARDGLFITRIFLRGEQPEEPDAVLAELTAGRIGSFQTFKFRLAMALTKDAARGVRVHDVWEFWERHGPRPEELANRLGWPPEQIATIEAYRDQDAVYFFPMLREATAMLAEVFEVVHCRFSPYEMGERFPTFVCALRSAEREATGD